MLEGTVARLLNHFLGKYVADLDIENLNVGIFSGHVQLTDLKLKAEALYELNLPIEVKVGTIGKIWLQIPWTSLWSQPIVVNIEDLLITFGPIVSADVFNPEKNKRLIRAVKRQFLANLDSESHVIGGPKTFSEHLLTNILNNMQFTLNNIHIRYEDCVSGARPLAAGLCVGSVSAETTNSKWKAARYDPHSGTSFYLIKIEALSAYWDCDITPALWNLPADYYAWRNAMSNSLQNYSINGESFDFVVKPMTMKVKMTMARMPGGNLAKCATDLIVQDCNVQLNKAQYQAMLAVSDSLGRMWTSWDFLSFRPTENLTDNRTVWWKYAYSAVVEQRIRPRTWSRIKFVREQYRNYMETYKQIILNPNDTELKVDLQKYEDNLSIVNIVIARQQARLLVQSRSLCEKNFWSMLPSPERASLCRKIGFKGDDQIDHKFTLRVGNVSFSLLKQAKEILVATLTQTNLTFTPDLTDNTFKALLKVEGLIVEGASLEEHLIPIVASEHLSTSPAYFFRAELEKMPPSVQIRYKLTCSMDSVECLYNKQSFDELGKFLDTDFFHNFSYSRFKVWPKSLYRSIERRIQEKWDLNLNIKIPFFVVPEYGSLLKAESILIVDLGRYSVTTEMFQPLENATQMELEEQLYTKLNIDASDIQILFCNNCDNWRDARKEKDTDLHLIPKTQFSAIYASADPRKIAPGLKFNINLHALKLNMSERRMVQFIKFFQTDFSWIARKSKIRTKLFGNDQIVGKINLRYLSKIENQITISNNFLKTTKSKKYFKTSSNEKILVENNKKEDMNEVWARNVDLPGLEDNISPSNNIIVLFRFVLKEFSLVFSRSSDSTDRQYLMFRLGLFAMDLAFMDYGPAYQISLNSILLTDKLHTTSSGQYIDLVYSPIPSNVDVVTILYRKVSASCPDFWSHFHGVETSLVADFGSINILMHQDAMHTAAKYSKYMYNKIKSQAPSNMLQNISAAFSWVYNKLHSQKSTPVPPGSIKFSQSGRMENVNIRVCDADFDIINIHLAGLEMDFLFRANERFVFRSFLSNLDVEHLSDVTLYSKVLRTDEDKVFEVKYVRHAAHIKNPSEISPNQGDVGGSFKLYLGQIHLTFLYKLVVQLQRFLTNLEVLQYIYDSINWALNQMAMVTANFKINEKIYLDINMCGPVLLLPQKSSSPNVMIVDTGELHVENFFKDYPDGSVENILVKWNGLTITRGVMTLSHTLEMQEILVEPVNLNLDVKRYTNPKTCHKSWDIDGLLDPIRITLGQRDIATILSIYTDNIAEGKIQDLFPKEIISPVVPNKEDETVKSLEAFFCEPKQKNIVAKFSLEEITLWLFFDSGELLSSPIRDLNHGLCKFIVTEINTSFVVYTDESLDGKLSMERVLIEEIGPDANIYDKGILQSPIDDNKNNNCHITINKPPIIDVTFHQNKSKDTSIDVIVGRLSLTLSVPFCEKLALFVLECLPKENLDSGIINHGYESDQIVENLKDLATSLTISLRINKPEFIFMVETTSNKKRYFVTHTEILSDYSRHNNRMNLVISLSGLHTLFYDMGMQSSDPYTILKQCDIEFSKCFTDEKGEKIIASISSIYVQICSRVVHSMTDVLNDIAEHFKVPDLEQTKADKKHDKSDAEDLWEPKKIADFHQTSTSPAKFDHKGKTHEILLVPRFDIVVILELDETQVVLMKSTAEVTVYDWSSLLNCTCEFTIQGNYFNENIQAWEPFLDPVVMDEKEYKPWDLLVKVFQDKSLPMLDAVDKKSKKRLSENKERKSTTTSDDEDSGDDMMFLEPIHVLHKANNRRVKTSLSTFLDDSDSESEDGTMEKLAAAISDLFTGDWNESEDSDYIHSSDEEESDDSTRVKQEQQKVDQNYAKSTYILVEAKEILNVTITPTLLKLLNDLFTIYSNKTLSIVSNKKSVNLINDIGPQSKVELYEKKIEDSIEEDNLVCAKTFENQDSAPNSPTKTNYYIPDSSDDFNDDKESTSEDYLKNNNYDFETLSSLQFPVENRAQLYDKINRNFIRVLIPNFLPIQTNCPKRNWQKLMRLHSTNPGQTYYLAAKHTIGKFGRNVVISSSLQIKNETCYALSVLYQPSTLQQLNLEPVGDVTNPFETTMRITVLEAHEVYNVPLYIAYHSKIFIQPAYADGHCVSATGIWWKDLATELDVAHNLLCRAKSETNQEVFALRVMLKRNLETQNYRTHTVPNYIIHLMPAVVIYNFLPYSLEIENVGFKLVKVEPGEMKSVFSLDLNRDHKLVIKIKYNGITWTGILNFTTYLEEKIVLLSSENKDNKEHAKNLAINVKTDREGSCKVFFYTAYWIVNKTELPLQIKASATNTVYESNNEDIVLFTYKRHGKQTLNVRVYESNWSNEFGLECAGTTGLIICKDNERKKKYLFFLNIKLSEMCPRLTKIVTFLPSFLITNTTSRSLRFMEHNEKTDLWIDLAPHQTLTFWPETSSMQMYVKYKGSKLISQAFSVVTANHTVLRMDKGGALSVEVTGGIKDSFRVVFKKYSLGDAPVLVKNYCGDLFLKIQQQDQSQVTLLSPYNSLLYTWDDPTKLRQLVWNVYNNKGQGFPVDILRDAFGEEKVLFHSVTPTTSVAESSSEDSDSSDSVKRSLKKIRRDKVTIYWLCYREDRQRILLFTQELRVFNQVLNGYFLEHCGLDALVSLSGVGLSVFTKEHSKKEHLYASLGDAPAVWEVNVGEKWKTLTLELASWIEEKYRLHSKKCQLRDYIHIDFEKMYMLKPFFAELKRTYTPALYFQYRKSPNYQYCSLKLQNLQVDNKICNTIVLQPLPSNNIKNLNPFIDLSVSKCSAKDCSIYRHIKLGIRNFSLSIENHLFVEISDLLAQYRKFQQETTMAYVADMKTIHDFNTTEIEKHDSRTIVEYLSISNFEILLNISNKIQISLTNNNNLSINKVLDYLFPINISPYMPMEGVIQKVSPIEQINMNVPLSTIIGLVFNQITSQFLQQYYSHVLGLQVLVNPFVLQVPIRALQTDSDKMAIILLYGSRYLLSHINMSPAALEQCVVDIFANQTMENIQRIRRHGSYQRTDLVPKTISASAKSFNCGVPNALNQMIVRQQNAGIHCDGEMFFKTTGKALFSIIARHSDEKTDAVEIAREALRRASLLGEPIRIQQRLTRYCNKYLGLKPFSIYESMGQNLLETVANCQFACDHYWSHASIDKFGKSIVLISLENVIRINKSRLWGPWEVEWVVDLDDIVSMPKITTTELIFNIRQNENCTDLLKICGDKEMLVWIHEKIEQAIIVSMEEKSWSLPEN